MDLRERVGALVDRLTEEEWAGRKAAGLPLHHVLDASEFPLRYATATLKELLEAASAWRAAAPNEPIAAFVLSQAQVIAGLHAEADATLAAYQKLAPDDPQGAMRFASPVAKPAREMPPVSGAWPCGPAFFISGDERYWKLFGIPLVRSIATLAPGAAVHAHVMAPNEAIVDDLKKLKVELTVTTEDPAPFLAASGVKHNEYANAMRFVRFAEALERTDGPLCIMDADALAYRDPLSIFDLKTDLALRARAGRFEAVHHVSACLVLARPGARAYFRSVADLIRSGMRRPWWGLDQYALYSALVRTKPEVKFLGPEWADVEPGEGAPGQEGAFWFTAGAAKTRLKTDDTPYARLFRRYWRMTP